MNRHLHRATLRYPRTAAEAFRDHTYGAAIERPARKASAFTGWLAFCILSGLAVVLIAWRA